MTRSIFRSASSRDRLFERYDSMLEQWPVPVQSSFVQTSFGVTHVLCSGPDTGAALLLLHPGRSNSVLWMRNVEKLSRTFRVLAIDIMGDAGKSEPDSALPFGFDRPWLLQILDSLFIDRVDIVALSRASQLAVNLAAYVPNRVGRLVLISASLNGSTPAPEMKRAARMARLVPSHANICSLLALLAPSLDSGDVMLGYQGAVYRDVREPAYPVYDPEEFGTSAPFAPTLLLLGEREVTFEPATARAIGRRLFPNITVEVMPEVGHLMNIERPEAVDSRIEGFLRS